MKRTVNRQLGKNDSPCKKKGGKESSTGSTIALSNSLSLFSSFLTKKRSLDYPKSKQTKKI